MDKNKKNFYISTPIFYPNSQLHLGHAYTLTITDIIARYKKLAGYSVYLQTGSDEHGEKIARTAKAQGFTPQQLVDKNITLFKQLWEKLDVSKDYFFVRTSSAAHITQVQAIFTKLLLSDDIYLSVYKGNYCILCEEYVLKVLVCPTCNSELKQIEEEAYFLRVNKYQQALLDYYEQHPNFLSPTSSLNELFQSFLRQELPDLCVTRNDLTWGVPVPGHEAMTIYVWFDALCNYFTSERGAEFFATQQEQFETTEIVQVIGKDILRFHAIYWISLLLALQKRMPNKILSHGWILNAGAKMSKSKGNVIEPLKLLENCKSDVLRAYFAGKVILYNDGVISDSMLQAFYEDFFLNALGNLFSRVFKMLETYRQNVIPTISNWKNNYTVSYWEQNSSSVEAYQCAMNDYQITNAFKEVRTMVSRSNKMISETKPWELFATNEDEKLDCVLVTLVATIEALALLLLPITPETATKVLIHMGSEVNELDFGKLFDYRALAGRKIQQNFTHLFKR